MQKVDTILSSRWMATMDGGEFALDNRSVAIQDGKIVAILPTDQMQNRFEADEIIDFPNHVLMPGFVNSHTHMAMNIMRGIADDLPLMTWLNDHIWPAECASVSAEFVYDGVQLALAELIKGGVTCVNDMYFYGQETAKAMHDAGMRGLVGDTIFNVETPWSAGVEDCYKHNEELMEAVKQYPLVDATVAAHAPYTNNEDSLKQTLAFAEKYDKPIHIHLQETYDEVNQHMALYKERPVETMARLGLLSDRMIAVHMTQVSQEDIDAFKKHGGSIVHCPESNMKLSSGACPVSTLLEKGVNVALGTDGAASNNDLDMIGEMRSAAFMAKLVDESPESLTALQVLEMATINGAKALHMGAQTGSLEEGKAADIIAIDLSHLNTQPVYNPIAQIVYAASNHQVSDVWVAGKRLLKDRELTTIDEQSVRQKAENWHDKIVDVLQK